MATNYFTRYRHIAPLAVLRIAFGAVLFFSTIRFIAHGWVRDFYIRPAFHFPFFGFEWLSPFSPAGMYTLYAVMAVAALFICIGFFYRVATPVFFLCFCYAELLDKTYYLNHYYLVTICSFLLILVPAHRYCSVDTWRRPSLKVTQVPSWTILVFKYQLTLIYCCAGLSKLTYDWLFRAMPLRIWLPANASIPVIGPLLRRDHAVHCLSWCGALFDLSIAFLLLNKSTRRPAYLLVIVFHILTAVLFQIGMFPYLMMSATLVFFSEGFHRQVLQKARTFLLGRSVEMETEQRLYIPPRRQRGIFVLLGIYFLLQLVTPFRFMLYLRHAFLDGRGLSFFLAGNADGKKWGSFLLCKESCHGKKV